MATTARPISESFAPANAAAPVDRPVSEFIPAGDAYTTPETDAIDKWVDDVAHYEETMEAMAKASLDQNFKDELNAIEQWFQVLSDPERTATLYSLLQHTNRVQQGFFIAVLQQMSRKDNRAKEAKEAKKLADAGRQRRLSSKPQLALAGTNEKYAQMYEARPRSAATATGTFPNGEKVVRPYSVMDQSAFEEVPDQRTKWQPMTPTFGNFSDVAKGIERPQSTNDIDRNALLNARMQAKMAGAVRSPLGPGNDAGFARAQRKMVSATPPLSAGLRAMHSPAFPPGLFPTNPWASGGDKKNSSAALKQKFATLIADSRADASKDAAAAKAMTEPKSPKPVEPIDFKLLSDIPAWFRSMRLHKYTPLFETLKWQDIIQMDDEALTAKGVAALGARRKMLKVFEQVKVEAAQKGIDVTPAAE